MRIVQIVQTHCIGPCTSIEYIVKYIVKYIPDNEKCVLTSDHKTVKHFAKYRRQNSTCQCEQTQCLIVY